MKTAPWTRFPTALLVMISALTMGTLLFATPAAAITIVPKCATDPGVKAPGLDCVTETFGNIAQLILGLTGSFALLMFVYGGFMLLSSGGSEEKVTKGKTILKNSVIGILIIMLSGYLIRYAVDAVTAGTGVQQMIASTGTCEEGKSKKYTLPSGKICINQCKKATGYRCTNKIKGKICLEGFCPGSGFECCK